MRRVIFILIALVLLSANAWALTKPVNVNDYDMSATGVSGTGNYGYSVVYLDNYDGGAYSGCVGEGCGSHPAVDILCLDEIVYSIASGTVYKVVGNVSNDSHVEGWGNYIMIKHTSSDINGLTENVYSVFAHLSEIGYDLNGDGGLLQKDDVITEGQSIAISGHSGTWDSGANRFRSHLHFQIDREKRLDNGATIHADDDDDIDRRPFWRGTWSTINTPDSWHENDLSVINPMAFLQMNEYAPSVVPVGFRLNEDYSGRPQWIGQPDNGISQEFRDRYDQFYTDEGKALGFPWENPVSPDWIDYGQAVHQIDESMWVQDLYSTHNGLNNPHSSLIKEYSGEVVILKEGFWDLWMNNIGWLNFGTPITEEDDYPSSGSQGKQQTCNLDGVSYYLRWVPGDIARAYDSNNNEMDLKQLNFMPAEAFKMVLDDGSSSSDGVLFKDFPEMITELDERSNGGFRKELNDKFSMEKAESLKSLQTDGVYHSEIKLADFGQNLSLVNGRTYDGFYVIISGQEFHVDPFTVNGNGTIEVNTSNPTPDLRFGYWDIYPNPGSVGQQIHVEGVVYNYGTGSVTLSELRIELLDPNGNEVNHSSAYNITLEAGYGLRQWIDCYPYMPGNHTARFRALINGQWTIFSTYTVYVEGASLISEFTTNVRLGDVPLTVQFTEQTTGNPTWWAWDFGDGNFSIDQNPSHTYNTSGVYTVAMESGDGFITDRETKYSYITVTDVLQANFTSNVTTGPIPLNVQFTDQSSGSPTSWLWNFGDGNVSSEQNPMYTYTSAGIYNVLLTVSDQSGSETITKTGYIVAGDLQSNFSANITSINAGEQVDFTDSSIGDPTSWTWDFGDGSIIAYDGSINHTYMDPGTYTVSLTVSNDMGTDIETKVDYITVGESVLSFTVDVVSGRVPLTVNFVGSGPGSSDIWCWDFGDGTVTGTGGPECTQYITHIYEEPGVYDVGLVHEGVYIIYENLITVSGSFTADVTEGLSPLTVNFTDESGFSASTWSWNFGDGNTSTLQNPSHTYSNAGFYTVTFVAGTGPEALTVVREDYIHVADSTMGFEADVTYGAAPLTVQFTNQSLGSPIFWGWDFGDGGQSIDENPIHTYNSTGLYSVMLLAMYGSHNDTLIYEDYIIVSNEVLASGFTSDIGSGVAPLTVQFTDQSTGGPSSWDWNFGDGSTSTLQNPSHIYESIGAYTVSLTVDNGGVSDSSSQNDFVVVYPAVNARFTSDVTQGLVALEVQFTDQSLGSPTSWLWNFGDGNTSTDQNPTHTYFALGAYDVSLTVSSSAGSNSLNQENYITVVDGLYANFTTNTSYGTKPLLVQFTDQSLGGPSSWLWNFGDGNTSAEQSPFYTYTVSGTYDVSLLVIAGTDSSSVLTEGCVVVSDTLSTNFSADNTTGTIPLTVQFTDQSSGSPTSWLWNFGDGNTSTDQSPVHIYTSVGVYTVSLLVSDDGGANSLVREDYITAVTAVVADFSADPTNVYTTNPIQFTDQSTGDPTSWAWDFGNGDTSTEQNPIHTYFVHGTYTVSLTVGDGISSDTLVLTDYITSSKPPVDDNIHPYSSPNPFNPTTVIHFKLKDLSHVTLFIYDVQGRKVKTLVDQVLDKGVHQATFDASRFSSGTYFYVIRSAEGRDVQKITLVK